MCYPINPLLACLGDQDNQLVLQRAAGSRVADLVQHLEEFLLYQHAATVGGDTTSGGGPF
jgi:hypothetical protein